MNMKIKTNNMMIMMAMTAMMAVIVIMVRLTGEMSCSQ